MSERTEREKSRRAARQNIAEPKVGDQVLYVGLGDGSIAAPPIPATVVAVYPDLIGRMLVADLRIRTEGGFGPPREFDRYLVPCDPFGKSGCWRWR